jgi:hypothetical protein
MQKTRGRKSRATVPGNNARSKFQIFDVAGFDPFQSVTRRFGNYPPEPRSGNY